MGESLPLLGARHDGGGGFSARGAAEKLSLFLLLVGAATLAGVALLLHQQSQLLAEVRAAAASSAEKPPPPLAPQFRFPAAPQAPALGATDLRASAGGANVLVVYVNGTHLPQLAAGVREGAERVLGANSGRVRVRTIEQASFRGDVMWADAVVLGSHVVNANVEPKMTEFLETWSLAEDLSGKVGAAFVTGGGISSGEELTMVNLLHSLLIFRLVVVGGERWTSAFGASAVVGEGPFRPLARTHAGDRDLPAVCYPTDPDAVSALFKDKAVGLGARVATVAMRLAAAA